MNGSPSETVNQIRSKRDHWWDGRSWIFQGSIHAILSDMMKMKDVSAKFIPHLLNMNQMETWKLFAAKGFKKSIEDLTFLETIVFEKTEENTLRKHSAKWQRWAHCILTMHPIHWLLCRHGSQKIIFHFLIGLSTHCI